MTNLLKMMVLAGFWIGSSAMAQQQLPKLTQPLELQSGAYAEGTNTQLTLEEIQTIQPWATNAKKDIDEALEDAKNMPIVKRVTFLTNEIKSIVSESGGKKYQMLMRYALNRGMLLVDMIDQESSNYSARPTGVLENKLDILERTMQVAKKFWEDDLAYENRVASGDRSNRNDYEKFGIILGRELIQAAKNIFDVSAQYRVLYKAFEMMAWDLYQSAKRDENARLITLIDKNLKRLGNGTASFDDTVNVDNVRQLKRLLEKVEAESIYKKKFK